MTRSDKESAVIYVGIGSSAGGLEAMRELAKVLSKGKRLTLLLAQHLSPSHNSMLVDLIRRECSLVVSDASDGLLPQPNHLYVTPPNRDIEVREGRIRLSDARSGPMPKPDINRFFQSLAKDRGNCCVGVILSGTGTDGAAGMIEIKAAGGITIAQTPQSAKYDGMPLASIHADAADLVQTPTQIAATLMNLDQHGVHLAEPTAKDSEDSFTGILDLVLRETGVNLVHYKQNSIRRRVRRRMSIRNQHDMQQYLQLLHSEPQEIHDLARDAFVGVTGFFRDPDAFDALSNSLAERCSTASPRDELRIWVPGCATGEEAYTIAILLEELRGRQQLPSEYRIFATDIGTDPLGVARLGHYGPEAVSGVEQALLQRYFVETASGYSVNRRIRDHVVFSTHDLIRDAPFSKLDLITCRNVMIYFDNELQRQVFDTFHYALRDGGLLMLGMSENNTQAEKLFAPIEPRWRIYRKLDMPGHRARLPHLLPDATRTAIRVADPSNPPLEGIEERLNRLLSTRFAPGSVVVNQHNEIMYSFGDLRHLMTVRPGPASLDILTLVHDAIRSSLRALIFKVRRTANQSAETMEQVLVQIAENNSLRVLVIPFDPNRPGWLCISFQAIARLSTVDIGADPHSDEDAQMMMALEHELFSTRESLQTVVEELETTNEELQAANEELQSSNEELLTLNDELQDKTRQYEQLANQLQNVQNSLDTPLLVVDKNLRLTRYAPCIDQLVDMHEIRLQDHITTLPWRSPPSDLREIVGKVIDLQKSYRGILHLGIQVWQLHVSPVLDEMDRIDGAILVFTDATELYASQERFRQEKERAQITLESIGEGVVRVDDQARVEYLNPVAAVILEWNSLEAIGKPLDQIFLSKDQAVNSLVNTGLRILQGTDPQPQHDHDAIVLSRSGKALHVSYSVGPTTNGLGVLNGAVITFRDMTDHHEALSRMSWMSSHDDLTGAVNRREMEKRIATALNAIQQGRKREAVFLYLDLDQFKVVNDTCGHLAGDELLKNVTRLLGQHIRHRDTVGRLGGDEFGILLEGCLLAEAELVAEKIRAAVEEFRFRWRDKIFRLGICIGVVALTPDSGHITDVLSNADAACYAAKERGRNRIQVHTPDDQELKRQRADLNWVSEITDAMDHDRLRLYLQEIRSFRDDIPSHWEVLLRMFNRKGKLMLPGGFLPAAERYGLIQRIDLWVVDKVFETLNQYRPATGKDPHPHINVNLSGHSFGDTRVADHIHQCLNEYDIDASRIVFEITETAAISDLIAAKAFIARIKSLGCRVALDDFGSGMSSLSYLKELDIDYIKVDGGFIQDIETNAVSQAIVHATAEIAKLLDIGTVAEFVSSPSQIDKLCELGITFLQGQAIGIPMPLESFLDETSH